jgi:FtsH-binding integral membrane protein
MDGRRGAAVIAIAAYGGCLAIAGLSTVLEGRARSVLIIPLALAFCWGFAVLIGSVLGVIFGERPEESTRVGMLFVAVCAALVAASLFMLADKTDSSAVEFGVGFLGAAAAWVCLGALMGAIFGELPEVGMSEGD